MTQTQGQPRSFGAARLLTFRRRHRLTHAREFQAVFAAKLRKSAGPLTVFAHPTDRAEPRLGLSIGKRVGIAVVRNRLKRQLREAFRHTREELPRPSEEGSYDLVVSSRPHAALAQTEYRKLFADAVRRAHKEHVKRQRRDAPEDKA
ncbi:MAG: ribonuclease P protein component [Planctomycetota bacterium]